MKKIRTSRLGRKKGVLIKKNKCISLQIYIPFPIFSFPHALTPFCYIPVYQTDGRIHLISSEVKDQLILRLAICSEKTDESWIQGAWKIIQELAKGVVEVKEEEDEEQVENKKRGD